MAREGQCGKMYAVLGAGGVIWTASVGHDCKEYAVKSAGGVIWMAREG